MIDFLIKIRKFSVSFLFFPFHPNLMVVKWMWFFTLFLSFAWGVHCTGTNNGYQQRILTISTAYNLPHTCPDLFLSGLLSDIVVPEEPELPSVVGGALWILLLRQSHQWLGKMATAPIKELRRHRGRFETFGFFLLLFVNLGNCLFRTYMYLILYIII